MKAVVYQAPFSIAAENVPDPELQHPNDGIVKITSSCICGSDLHLYEGRTATLPSNASRPRSEPANIVDAGQGVIKPGVWSGWPCCQSTCPSSVSFGFLVVAQVFVDPCTQVVRFRVVAWEEFDVPVHVGQGVLPIRRRQLGESNRTVAVPHGVVRVQFYRTGGVLDTLLGLGYRRYGVGVQTTAPEAGVFGSSSIARL